MSDITYADKVEGSSFTPEDANEIKSAVNSKQDKSNLTTDFSSPNNNDFPTVQAVVDYVALPSQNMYRGTIDGTEDLGAGDFITKPGFWTPVNTFSKVHASYPGLSANEKPVLVSYAKNGVVIHVMYVLAANSISYSRHIFRTYDPEISEWGEWTEFTTTSNVATDFDNPTHTTVPTTLAVTTLLGGLDPLGYGGELDGSEDLTALESGWYLPASNFNTSDNDYSFVSGDGFPVPKKGILIIFNKNTAKYLRYIVLPESDNASIDEYIKTGVGGVWSKWMRSANTSAGNVSTSVSSPAGFSASAGALGAKDDGGKIIIQNDSGDSSGGVSVILTFQYPDDRRYSALLTPANEKAASVNYWVSSLSPSAMTISLKGSIGVGESVELYYSVFKK